MRPLPLRLRLAAWFLGGVAVLMAIGAGLLYLRIAADAEADMDRELDGTAQAARKLYEYDLAEYRSPQATVAHIVGELVFGDRRVVAVDGRGHAFVGSQAYGDAPTLPMPLAALPLNQPTTIATPDGRVRALHVHLADDLGLIVAMSFRTPDRRLATLRWQLAAGLLLVLALGGVVGVAGARGALRPLGDAAAQADRVASEVESGATMLTRLPVPASRDELATLGTALNGLAARLESALAAERAAAERQRRFLQDAAHELRTPIAIIRSEAEGALAEPRNAAGDAAAFARLAHESARLGALVGDLLLLAREREPSPRNLVPLFLDDVAQEALARAQRLPIAAGREIRLGAFGEAPVVGDAELLQRAIVVLLENALLHAPGSSVEVSAGTDAGGGAWLAVRDWGPGVPPEARERIFERFARLQLDVPGTGLGLPIARWIAERHGGTLAAESPDDGRGIIFRLRLPQADPSPAGGQPSAALDTPAAARRLS